MSIDEKLECLAQWFGHSEYNLSVKLPYWLVEEKRELDTNQSVFCHAQTLFTKF